MQFYVMSLAMSSELNAISLDIFMTLEVHPEATVG